MTNKIKDEIKVIKEALICLLYIELHPPLWDERQMDKRQIRITEAIKKLEDLNEL